MIRLKVHSIASLCGRVWTRVSGALHESRAGEAARIIKRYRHLVAGPLELGRISVVAAADGGRQARAVEKLP